MKTTTVHMVAEVRAKPERAEEVAELFKAFAEHIRRQPGCDRVEVFQLSDEPDRFFAFLSFADEQSFVSHLEDRWRQCVVQQAGGLLAERPRRHVMERLT